MSGRRAALPLFVFLVPSLAWATDAPPPPPPAPPPVPPVWSGNASAGYQMTGGNSKSTSVNFKGDLEFLSGPWSNSLTGAAASASTNNSTTAENYAANEKLNYSFTPKDFVFGSLNYVNNRFSGVLEQYSEAVGYGRRLIASKTQTLDTSIGVGANEQRLAPPDGHRTQAIGVFDLNYIWQISSSAEFHQTIHVESGKQNTFVDPISSLKLNIAGNLFAQLTYEAQYNSNIPAGRVHTDTFTTVNFGYSFGKKT
jgi:Putative salt-induced outer membrane protein